MNKVLHSSKSTEWETPHDLFNQLNKEFHFTLDPCATKENAKCDVFWTKEDNGLNHDWAGHTVFMNPPYGRGIGNWMQKALSASMCGATVVCLVPARTDTQWWHNFAVHGEIRYLKGRLKFGGCKNSAPFPSAIITFRPPKALRIHALAAEIASAVPMLAQDCAINNELTITTMIQRALK